MVLLDLAALFDTEVSDSRLGMYFAALRDLSFDEVQVAIHRAIQHSRFFPKPAELRAYVTESKPDSGALLAALQAAMRKYGTTPGLNPAPHLPPLLNLLVERLGGWYVVMGSAWEDLSRHVEKLAPPLVEAAVVRGMTLALSNDGPSQTMRRLPEPGYDNATPQELEAGKTLVRRAFAEKIKP